MITNKATYLLALKTSKATPESSATFRKILQHAAQAANATYNAVQLELFDGMPKPKRIMLRVQAELF
jgi:hypothetical protein